MLPVRPLPERSLLILFHLNSAMMTEAAVEAIEFLVRE